MFTLFVMGWILIGIGVVRLTDNGGIAMVAHNYPLLGILMLLLSWILWPGVLILYFIGGQ